MVVIMVLQIAGSSGSYPIEILPQIFSGIYLFFPFPYAINAMRETMCGMYRYDLYKYLGELLLFGVAAVLIGRVVMKWTGHSDYKAMKPYIDVADSIRAREMNKMNNLL